MSRKSYKWIAVIAALLAAAPACAQSRHRRPSFDRGADGDAQRQPPRPEQAPRETERDEFRPQPGRMSPEERRQLRRDINEAGHDLYRRPLRR